MPTYEYECQKCGVRSEKFQSITDKPLRTCSACGGKLKRLLGTGAGIIFKGSGFYATDYRSESYKKRAQEDSSSGKKSDSASSCSSCAQSKACPAKKE